MREISFKDKVYSHTRYAVDAIAWATNRRGHNAWKSDNVVGQIWDYLEHNNVKMETVNFRGTEPMLVNRESIRRALLRLEEAGFGKIKHSSSGRYIVEFEFAADVILTGHDVTRTDPVDRLKAHAAPAEASAPAPQPVDLPLPELPFQRYRAGEVDELLTEYQKRNPDGNADYIDRLIDTLKVVLYG